MRTGVRESPGRERESAVLPSSLLDRMSSSFDDGPTVNCQGELTKATSGSHNLRRRSGADPAGAGSALRRLAASHLAQLDDDVGAGLVPALRKGTHEGCPYPSWFGGKVHGGDGPSADGSPYGERPFGHRGSGERDLYPRGSAGR